MPFKTFKLDKQASGIEYTGNWTGLANGTEIQLEDASSVTGGVGFFGLDGRTFANETGGSAVALIEGTDYDYDEYLDSDTGGTDLYDTGISGALATNKIFRIVEDGVNISDAGGLNLRVVAKNLNNIISPPSDECYVDPNIGKFLLLK